MNKRLFQVKKGSHFDKSGKEYKEGDVIETTRDLCSIYVGKFEEVKAPKVANVESSPEEDSDDEENTEGRSTTSNDQSFGEDVTEEFALAKRNMLKVYKRGKLYHVVDPSEDATKTIDGGEGLKKASTVKTVVKEYLQKN